MNNLIWYLIIFVPIGAIILYGQHIKKQREAVGFLETGINHKLLFDINVKSEIHKVNFTPDKFTVGITIMAGATYKPPEINYWHWINENGEKIGTTFLIREDDAFQFEMSYDEFLKVQYKILEIMEESDFEQALENFFYKASKNVKLVAIQFEDILVKADVQYEKIIGL